MRHPRLARVGRRDLLWSIACFLALQIGLAATIEVWLPELRDPHYAYRAERLRHRVVDPAERPLTVLLMGSSRIQRGFQASKLEARLTRQLHRPVVVFNFGIPGSGPVANLRYFRRLLREGIRPDLVFCEVVPGHLTDHLVRPVEAQYIRADCLSLNELAWLNRYRFSVADLTRDWWTSWPVPWHVQRFKILSRIAPGILPVAVRLDSARLFDDSGWQEPMASVTHPTAEARQAALAFAQLDHGENLRHFRLGGPACLAMRDFLDLCRQEGIPAAMLVMPEGPTYRSWYPPHALADIHAFLDSLSQQYGAPLIDAQEWIVEEDFSDSHHLLLAGATEFSDRFDREVLGPIFDAQGSSLTYPLAWDWAKRSKTVGLANHAEVILVKRSARNPGPVSGGLELPAGVPAGRSDSAGSPGGRIAP